MMKTKRKNRKREWTKNLENATKVKRTKCSVRALKWSHVLCGEETQCVLDELDHHLNTYHYERSQAESKDVENTQTEDDFEYSHQYFSDDYATQIPGPTYKICLLITVLILSCKQSSCYNWPKSYKLEYRYSLIIIESVLLIGRGNGC